jgi:hypothetical protein
MVSCSSSNSGQLLWMLKAACNHRLRNIFVSSAPTAIPFRSSHEADRIAHGESG